MAAGEEENQLTCGSRHEEVLVGVIKAPGVGWGSKTCA